MRTRRETLQQWASVLGFLALWEGAVDAGVLAPGIASSPSRVAAFLARLVAQPYAGSTLGWHVLTSLARLALGGSVAAGLGLALGLSMGLSRPAFALTTPIFDAFSFVPPICWSPFALLWIGITIPAQALVVFFGVLPGVVVNTWRGVRMINPILIDAARTLGASDRAIFREVLLPGALPMIISGLKIGFALGMTTLVAAELVGAQSGVGYLIEAASQGNNITAVVSGMVLVGLLGFAVELGTNAIDHRLSRWRG